MAKCKTVWSGSDSYGRSVEVAESVNGSFFFRVSERTRYGLQWSKWQSHEPTFETHGVNQSDNCPEHERVFEYSEPQMFCGFNKMEKHDKAPNYRLPY